MIFRYKAIAPDDTVVSGETEAADRRGAKAQLAGSGLRIVSLEPVNGGGSDSSKHAQKGVKSGGETTALLLFKKLAQLCGSGAMPVSDALKSLAARSLDPRVKEVAKSLYKDIGEGRTLAVALERYPEMFDSCARHLVEAGEATANLPFVFKNLIKYIEDRRNLRKTIVSALAYPVFLCVFACGVVALFMFFMLPKIKEMMSNMGAKENFPMAMMDFLGNFLATAAPAAAVLAVAAAFFVKMLRRRREGRVKTDAFVLKIPVVSRIVLDAESARMCSLASVLLASGVPTTEAFAMSEKSIKNEDLRLRFRDFRTAVNDGAQVAAALQKFGILPDEDIDIIAVGEKTGSLVGAFSEIAQIRADELQRRIKTATAVLGGAALAAAFVLVFIFATGIVLSILGLSQSIAK